MDVIVKGQPSIEIGFETKVIQVGSLGDIDSALSTTSENPVMNKIITAELSSLGDSVVVNTNNISSLAESKADKDGVYSGMTVGRSIDLLGVEDVEEGSFLFRATDGDGSIKDGVAVVKSVKGDSVVWNQHIKGIIESVAGLSISISDDDIISINGTATSALANMFATDYGVGGDALKNAPLGRYVLDVKIINNPDNLSVNIFAFNGRISFPNTGNYTTSYQKIGDCSSLSVGGGFGISSYGGTGTVFNNVRFKVSLYNLTQMFGAGNEPSTIEEFNARVATLCIEDMNAYNEGEVVNMKASAIKSVGFNAWDEEWENGTFNTTTGANIDNSQIRSKNLIKVLPDTEYHVTIPSFLGNDGMWVLFYDQQGELIEGYKGGDGAIVNNAYLVRANSGFLYTAKNAWYIKFYMPSGYGSTYKNDICINLVHSGYRNGEYEPYVEDVLALPTLDLFPNGMSKIGDVYDEYDSEKSVQRIGIRPYQSGDESIENVLTDGTSTFYVLEEPIVTPHDYRLAYKAWDFGTEQVIADGNTTAITAGIIYEFNARDTIRSNKTRLDVLEPIVAGKIDKEADDYYPQLAVGLADNLAGVDVVDSEVNFRRSGGGAISDGVARIEAIKGNSVVWNQLRGSANRISLEASKGGISVQYNIGDILQNITGTYEGFDGDYNWYNAGAFNNIQGVIGHKYICSIKGNKNTLMTVYGYGGPSALRIKDSVIITAETATSINIVPSLDASMAIGTVVNESIFFLCTDLTQMFGAGNEPTTIEEFYARKPMGIEDEYAYNEGEVIHMDVQSIESQGVNAWDEEWEVGTYNPDTGALQNSTTIIRSMNFINVLPNVSYYIKTPASIGTKSNLRVYYYDNSNNYLGCSIWLRNDTSIITTPTNCAYITFVIASITSYDHDICINISDTSINGKYFPYIKRVEYLSIIRKYFPQGMKSAGTAHDEIRYNKVTQKWEYSKGKIKTLRLADLVWYYGASQGYFYSKDIDNLKGIETNKINILCDVIVSSGWSNFVVNYGGNKATMIAGYTHATTGQSRVNILNAAYTDVSAFIAWLEEANATLYYESNDWEWVELDAEDQFKDLDYQVWNCGTEKAIAEGKSAPLAADITYGFNAIGKIKELESLVAALRAKVGI